MCQGTCVQHVQVPAWGSWLHGRRLVMQPHGKLAVRETLCQQKLVVKAEGHGHMLGLCRFWWACLGGACTFVGLFMQQVMVSLRLGNERAELRCRPQCNDSDGLVYFQPGALFKSEDALRVYIRSVHHSLFQSPACGLGIHVYMLW